MYDRLAVRVEVRMGKSLFFFCADGSESVDKASYF